MAKKATKTGIISDLIVTAIRFERSLAETSSPARRDLLKDRIHLISTLLDKYGYADEYAEARERYL